jgi:hypothetical protein
VAALPGWAVQNSLGFGFATPANPAKFGLQTPSANLTAADVKQLLDRASSATSSTDAIIAIVDRGGRILGVRVEAGVQINSTADLVFKVDGAVAKARTGAFFGNNEAPLTSRTIRNISQTTLTQSEIESNPNDPNRRGPGFVGIVGVGGHFLPGVTNVPHVDLFGIEHTNRDSRLMPGADGVKGNGDDVALNTRFNAEFISGKEIGFCCPARTGSRGRRTTWFRPTASCRQDSRAGSQRFRAGYRFTRTGCWSAGWGCSSPDRMGTRRLNRVLWREWGNPMPSA